MKKTLFFLALLAGALLSPAVQAQQRYLYGGNRSKGTVVIKGDVAVKQLVEKHIELNERVRTIPGYRIQVASMSGTASKNRAFEMKERLRELFPEVEPYVVYDEPNFKVKVGDFRSRLEAFLFLQRLRSEYPGTIVKDNIYPMQIDWTEMVPESEDDI